MIDIEQARFNMIEQQIRPWDVLEPRILDAVAAVQREAFVPAGYRELAFADIQVPLTHGEVMLEPKLAARLAQALDPQPNEKILQIGTGSGYLTALLASLAGEVTSVEIHSDLSQQAGRNLAMAGFANVKLECGDAAQGWAKGSAWDGIVITGSLPVLPDAYLDALKPGGRLVAIVGSEPAMEVNLYTRQADGIEERSLFETVVPPLRNAQAISSFEF